MEYRTLELNIISAKDIKNVNLFSKMDVYVVISLTGDPYHLQSATTHVDKDGGCNPKWNYPVKFSVNEALAKENRLTLEAKLISDRTLGDTVIGTVHVPLRELVDNPGEDNGFRHVSYKVVKSSGKSKGSFDFSYKFAEKVSNSVAAGRLSATASKAETEPVMAYPPQTSAGTSAIPYGTSHPPPPNPAAQYGYPPQQPSYTGYPPVQSGNGYPPQQSYGGYPPQQNGYGGYPPQNGYGYGYQGYPQQGGYGYPPAQKPKKNNFGMGLGAGLLGGALGGMLIGDMVSDAADYDAGYDAGFDDAGGFDF
ncbi:protein SRC2-like [Vigna umbellata]|uniref:protein SRC2-like n=1 Tax=Vigna umbellata TaxID=87088 RepID=UPI001F5FA568|nr:protein SRC2-like [Vigna umbellata]